MAFSVFLIRVQRDNFSNLQNPAAQVKLFLQNAAVQRSYADFMLRSTP